jgi:hypothetical protein
MPAVFRYSGFKCFFYSNEGTPRERVHIHVEKGENEANSGCFLKFLWPAMNGYDARTLRDLIEIVRDNRELIVRTWENTSFRTTHVRFDEDSMWVYLSDGRTLGVPLAWFPRLLSSSP